MEVDQREKVPWLSAALEAGHDHKVKAETARNERATMLSQLQGCREQAEKQFTFDTSGAERRDKDATEQIIALREQLRTVTDESDDRVLTERSRLAAVLTTERSDLEAAVGLRYRDALDGVRSELGLRTKELAEVQAERDGIGYELSSAAAADKERMMSSHAAELEQAAGAAGTEVLRLTEAVERSRRETAEAKKLLNEGMYRVGSVGKQCVRHFI